MKKNINVGILGFQGDIEEHEASLGRLGVVSCRVKEVNDLTGLTHLIIPGGESTVMGKYLKSSGVGEEIQKLVKNDELAVYGTCAGAIICASEVMTKKPVHELGLIDMKISRNAYGSQIHSFSEEVFCKPLKKTIEAVFIRAPKIMSYGDKVEVLAEVAGEAVMLQQGRVLVSAFHPELLHSSIIHEFFLDI